MGPQAHHPLCGRCCYWIRALVFCSQKKKYSWILWGYNYELAPELVMPYIRKLKNCAFINLKQRYCTLVTLFLIVIPLWLFCFDWTLTGLRWILEFRLIFWFRHDVKWKYVHTSYINYSDFYWCKAKILKWSSLTASESMDFFFQREETFEWEIRLELVSLSCAFEWNIKFV